MWNSCTSVFPITLAHDNSKNERRRNREDEETEADKQKRVKMKEVKWARNRQVPRSSLALAYRPPKSLFPVAANKLSN